MSYLKPDKIYNYTTNSGSTISVNQKIIPDTAIASKYVASWVPKGAKMKPCAKISGDGVPRGLCIHNTSYTKSSITDDTAELYTLATWPNCNMGGVVVHYYVYKTNIWQNLKLTEYGWHASDGTGRYVKTHDGKSTIGGNYDCIAIEVVGSDDETNQTAAKLCAYLCNRFQFDPKQDIYTHNYFMNKKGDVVVPTASKNCPYYLLPTWNKFLDMVESYNTTPKRVITVSKTVKNADVAKTVADLTADGFTIVSVK